MCDHWLLSGCAHRGTVCVGGSGRKDGPSAELSLNLTRSRAATRLHLQQNLENLVRETVSVLKGIKPLSQEEGTVFPWLLGTSLGMLEGHVEAGKAKECPGTP